MNNIVNLIKQIRVVLLNRLFSLLPVKNNKIIFISYYGSLYGCNPKYISEFLISEQCNIQFDIVWVLNDSTKKLEHGERIVKNGSWKYFYELATAKFVITNFRLTDSYNKKKEQFYIQTWHSSLRLKNIENDAIDKLPVSYVKMAQNDSTKIDLLLSGCKASTEIFRRAFWYNGEILEAGTPRNDIFKFGDTQLKNKIRDKLNLKAGVKVFLYAPTFRDNTDLSVFKLNYDVLLETLRDKFPGDWVILERYHPHMIGKIPEQGKHPLVFGVTEYDDIQELLFLADFLVTDYSALMFDYLYSQKPCVLYVPDYVEYVSTNRKLYFDINELPFPTSLNQGELLKEIMNFDNETYIKDVANFNDKIGTFETGNASHVVSNYIFEKLDISNDK